MFAVFVFLGVHYGYGQHEANLTSEQITLALRVRDEIHFHVSRLTGPVLVDMLHIVLLHHGLLQNLHRPFLATYHAKTKSLLDHRNLHRLHDHNRDYLSLHHHLPMLASQISLGPGDA